MREKIISMLVILAIILSATIPSFAAYTNITLEEIKMFLEEKMQEDEDFKSISIEGNSLKMTGQDGLELKLFYNSENNTFYSEETFDNTMDSNLIKNKMGRNRMCAILWIFSSSRKKRSR